VIRYVIRRLMYSVALFFTVTLIGFALFFLIPHDPAKFACGRSCTPQMVAQVAHYLGTDRPLLVQYARFVGRLMPVSFHHGPHLKRPNLGRSFVNRQSVDSIVAAAAPETGSLAFGAVIIFLLVAVPVGVFSAVRPRSLLDRISMTGVLMGISAHPVWLGLIASWLIGFKLHLTPISGYANFLHPLYSQPGGPLQWAYHLLLPWLTLAVLYMAVYVRMIRANVMETLNEDYVRTARAKGAPELRVMRAHVLRNALLPIVTMLGMDIGLVLGGAVFTETVYSIQGLGFQTVSALNNYDSPTVLGILVFATTVIIAMNLLVDLLYAWIDPRIRLQ
jgi:peptide/nickel transport system permease protein